MENQDDWLYIDDENQQNNLRAITTVMTRVSVDINDEALENQ